ncbi:M24 family metallopeptidase [Halobaculum magnesiiphilum]|uniref:Xaa-Pro peptidase family protein n=1 Tax=Halobaculum magnesiiphilum TaxID=1017351 RepID=A0A8T8WFM8_9EURY|nr:Xaa-Pro peptidase family protein [Halobaculum magnesiiphilum]QZP38667.1 Xaa-Pro peptidase family protein [Halobaculum magnesiiphilum]
MTEDDAPDASSEDDAPYARRLDAARDRLRSGAGDALVLFPSTNLRYLTGYSEHPSERHFLLFVVPDADPVFLVPELSGEQVRAETAVDDVRTWGDDEDPVAAVGSVAADLALANDAPHVLVDDTMHARFTQDLHEVLPGATFGLASEVLADLRVIKDDAEVAALRRAGEAADAVIRELRADGDDVVGMTEADLARHIEDRLVANGGTGVSFETIVGSGPNGAMPHHTHGDRVIRAGDPVVLDFGTRVDGYPSDQTRTLVFGDASPPEGFREVHRVVREAQEAAVEAVEPGVTTGEVDAAAREVIEEAGYGEEFIHRTGHGVGLDVHEEPFVVAGGEREIEAGMVFSVEPGVYLPDEFGVRIEDLVVVTDDGCVRLNRTDRDWKTA